MWRISKSLQKTCARSLQVALFLATFSFLILEHGVAERSDEPEKVLSEIIKRSPWNIGAQFVDFETGKILYASRAQEPLKPASVMKVVTSAAVLDSFSPAATLLTDFYYDERTHNRISTLYVRGMGDPSLTIEAVWLIARHIRSMGITSIGALVVDDTAFVEARPKSGARAYQTGASAISFNFNSISFLICPRSQGEAASVTLDPLEAGYTFVDSVKTTRGMRDAIAIEEGATKDRYVISGTIGEKAPCKERYRSISDPSRYFARTFIALLAKEGVTPPATAQFSSVPSQAKLLYSHPSKPMRNLLEDLNHFSNNFIGEQLLYLLGEEEGRYSRERGIAHVERLLRSYKISADAFRIEDGSGLLHENRLSAEAITTILRATLKSRYSVEFLNSLSVGAESGTLKERDFGEGVMVRGKTGTLNGVSSLAGTFQAKSGKRILFAILSNNLSSKEKGLALEEQLVHTVYSGF